MTNARFNRIWDRVLTNGGHIEFENHGNKLTICQIEGPYGKEYSLRCGGSKTVILNHWNKERFREILVD